MNVAVLTPADRLDPMNERTADQALAGNGRLLVLSVDNKASSVVFNDKMILLRSLYLYRGGGAPASAKPY